METFIYTNWLLFQPAGYPDSEIPPHATQTPQRQRSSRTDLRLQGSDCQFQEHSRSFLLGFQRRTSVHGGTAPPFRSQSPCRHSPPDGPCLLCHCSAWTAPGAVFPKRSVCTWHLVSVSCCAPTGTLGDRCFCGPTDLSPKALRPDVLQKSDFFKP